MEVRGRSKQQSKQRKAVSKLSLSQSRRKQTMHLSSKSLIEPRPNVRRSSPQVKSMFNSSIGPESLDQCIDQGLVQKIKLVMKERRMLISLLEKSLALNQKTKKQLQGMKGQADMMMTLLSDLMNQAQLQNDTFQLNNDYFNLLQVVKKCQKTFLDQCGQRQVSLLGPIIATPLHKYYFAAIFGIW